MDGLFRFPGAVRDNSDVEVRFAQGDPLRQMVRPWFDTLMTCGGDVGALMHDGRPTVCASEAAFAYVDAYTAHAAIGFWFGADLPDPAGLLEGAGKRMRHVKLRWGDAGNEAALSDLITAAYADIQRRLAEA